jgi:hypothetical protein
MKEERPALRMSRWRPVCPECGYQLRGLLHPRCPECGVDFPTTNRTFRRWAIRRLPWDRLTRGSLLVAYLGTLLRILFVPWRAGQAVAVPDRWGRAIRWGAAHVLLCALAATMLGHWEYYPHWLANQFDPWPRHPTDFSSWDTPGHRVWIWAMQSTVAWMIVLASFPLVGVIVSLGMPRRHRAAKLTGAKWGLYASPVLLVTLAGWYGYYFIYPQTGYYAPPHPPPPIELLAFVYGTWWATGLVINQYDKYRWLMPVLPLTLCYACLWWGLTELLFPGGPLEALL